MENRTGKVCKVNIVLTSGQPLNHSSATYTN